MGETEERQGDECECRASVHTASVHTARGQLPSSTLARLLPLQFTFVSCRRALTASLWTRPAPTGMGSRSQRFGARHACSCPWTAAPAWLRRLPQRCSRPSASRRRRPTARRRWTRCSVGACFLPCFPICFYTCKIAPLTATQPWRHGTSGRGCRKRHAPRCGCWVQADTPCCGHHRRTPPDPLPNSAYHR